MNNKLQRMKKLALIAAQSNQIPTDIADYVLNYLGKQDLKEFLKYYKMAVDKKVVYVATPDSLSTASLNILKNLYKAKELKIKIDTSLGAGLKIQEDDMIVDFSIKKYINDTIEELKN